MRSRLLAVLLLAGLVGGCGPAAAPIPPQPVDAGWPALPGTVTLDEDAPLIAASGPVGRGALLLDGGALVQFVLEDGRQFRLPDPPRGEGRFAAISATLSPDGWWLGYRAMRFAGDPRYVLRSLANGRVVSGEGRPVRWSVDSRRLLLWDSSGGADDQFTILDVMTGDSSPAGPPRQVEGILPTGELLTMANIDGWYDARMNGVSLRTGDGPPVEVRFAERDDDACWCPTGTAVLAPDGSRVSLMLRFREGLTPGTDVKVSGHDDADGLVVVLDRLTGEELARATVPAQTVALVADRGADLLLFVGVPERDPTLVAFDPVSGTQRVVTVGPRGAGLVAPGMWTSQPDG